MRDRYADFIEKAGLTPDQAEQFVELQAEAAVIEMVDVENFFDGDEGTAEGAMHAQAAAAEIAQIDQQLEKLLGPTTFAQLNQGRESQSENETLSQIREQLRENGLPLEDRQAETLLEVIKQEKAATPSMIFDPRGPGTQREKMRLVLQGNNVEQFSKELADLNARILTRAGAILDAGQLKALADFQRQHLEVQRLGIKVVARKIRENGARSSEPAASGSATPR